MKFIKVYVLEKEVDGVLGSLGYGAFDPRVRGIAME
jgi:hypothetical protein